MPSVEITDSSNCIEDWENDCKDFAYDTFERTQSLKESWNQMSCLTQIGELATIRRMAEPMQKYICTSCGFIYDPEKGDPDGGIPPGTPFEKIPENWICPSCGARKGSLKPYDDKAFSEKLDSIINNLSL